MLINDIQLNYQRRRARLLRAWRKVRADRDALRADNAELRRRWEREAAQNARPMTRWPPQKRRRDE